MYLKLIQARAIVPIDYSNIQVNSSIRMPSQLVKCAFGFRSFNDPKTKCVPLSVELGSQLGGRHVPPVPPPCHGPCLLVLFVTDIHTLLILFVTDIHSLLQFECYCHTLQSVIADTIIWQSFKKVDKYIIDFTSCELKNGIFLIRNMQKIFLTATLNYIPRYQWTTILFNAFKISLL